MRVIKINTAESETWYRACQSMSTDKIDTYSTIATNLITGYGTTPESAIADCIQNIKRLKKQNAKDNTIPTINNISEHYIINNK